jgi:predicted Fe-Mo cluster-binding NifX family protein
MNSPHEEQTIVAVPVVGEKLCEHFGHCQQFVLFDVDLPNRTIRESWRLDPPPHEPGLLPRWLHGQKVRLVIAGGMGRRAQDIFGGQGIEVVVGAPADRPEAVVQAYLNGQLTVASNPCDH